MAPTTADLMAEIVALRGEVAELRATPPVKARVRVRKVPGWGAIYWLANFPVFIYLFFWQRSFWDTAGVFVILMYSLYANLATDYGAMSAALAAQGKPMLPELPLEED